MVQRWMLYAVFFMAVSQGLKAQDAGVSNGLIRHFHDFPSRFVAASNVDVWLPADYSSKKKYAVLYMQDGQMLFDSTVTWNKQEWCADETAGKLISEGKVRRFIIVGIFNGGKLRHCEYMPQKPFESLPQPIQDSLYATNRNTGYPVFNCRVQSDNYLRFLVEELKPFIDSVFSTDRKPSATFIMGSSMGGLISLYAICEYPGVFGGAACVSTHWPGIFETENNPLPEVFLSYMNKNLPSPKGHRIYFDYGDQTLDAMYRPYQLEADKIMKKKGFGPKSWKTMEFKGENHSERAWAKRLTIPLEFLLGR